MQWQSFTQLLQRLCDLHVSPHFVWMTGGLELAKAVGNPCCLQLSVSQGSRTPLTVQVLSLSDRKLADLEFFRWKHMFAPFFSMRPLCALLPAFISLRKTGRFSWKDTWLPSPGQNWAPVHFSYLWELLISWWQKMCSKRQSVRLQPDRFPAELEHITQLHQHCRIFCLHEAKGLCYYLKRKGWKWTLFPCLGPSRMAQDAASFECKPWRWKEGHRRRGLYVSVCVGCNGGRGKKSIKWGGEGNKCESFRAWN